MRRVLILIIPVLIGYSCVKDKNDLSVTGDITVSSERIGTTFYYVVGFSFEREEFVKILNLNEDADLVPVAIKNVSGQDVGLRFSITTNPNSLGFYLNGTFPELHTAEEYFNEYLTAEFPSYLSLSDTIKPYQVYTMKTSRENRVKFLVKGIRNKTNYFEADLKYVIQRDGTDEFPI